ncbi:hypothetical protein [Streptomyces sp. 769]|uniref:hypothetical protein n=1 Tax=Streptomyces sp. 769 TaxID=1262452 RepID=UPI000582096B|nr:hypothetical protein [Streptomyces sp. 769]AJC53648.1 Rhodopirellula transposase family protein [Streptomyces sp. 769]
MLLTVPYLRQICSQRVMSDLLEINNNCISKAIVATRKLLDEHKITIEPATQMFTSPEQVLAYLRTGETPVGRPPLPAELPDHRLTGMSRADLKQLIERLSVQRAALVDRRRFKQRGVHR